MSNATALLIAIVCLYSTHHWIGATVLLVVSFWALFVEETDPLGVDRLIKAIQSYKR